MPRAKRVEREVSFDVSKKDRQLVTQIVERAAKQYPDRITDKLSLTMDLEATAANGCPMRFADLLAADDFNFAHDVFGIMNTIDRTTGNLTRCFRPRFSKPARKR